jgi:hypothetical protein
VTADTEAKAMFAKRADIMLQLKETINHKGISAGQNQWITIEQNQWIIIELRKAMAL